MRYDVFMPAPAPQRRFTKRRILWSAAALFALLLAWQVYDILTGKPKPTVDYATPFYALCASAQPEGENAWPLLVEVLERVNAAKTQLEQEPLANQHYRDGSTYPGDFDDLVYLPRDSPRLRAHMHTLNALAADGTFNLIAQVAGMPRCVRPRVDGTPFHEMHFKEVLPRFAQLRTLTRLQVARLHVAAGNRKWQECRDIIDESLSIFRQWSFHPTLLDHLVAVSCMEAVLAEVRTILVERSLDERSARALLDAIDRQSDLASVEFAMEGERLLFLDKIQHEYTASGRLPLSSFNQYTTPPTMPGTPPPPRSARATLAGVAAVVIPGRGAAERLSAEYTKDLARVAIETDQTRRDEIDDYWDDRLPMHQVVLRDSIFRPSLMAGSLSSIHHSIAATRLMLGLEIYIKRHGLAPERLDDLVPDCLPEIPIDPLNGKGWGYRLRGPSASIASYDLWSFGRDGEDNNCYEGDGTVSLRHTPGTDIWINKPRHIPEGLVW